MKASSNTLESILIFFFPSSSLALHMQPLIMTESIGLFSFWQNIITNPITFSKTYFKKGLTQPLFKDKARTLYFIPNIFIIVSSTLILLLYSEDKSTESPIFLILFFTILSFLAFIFLFTNFIITKWLLRTSITCAGFQVEKKEAEELSLYLMAHMQGLFLFLIISSIYAFAIIFFAAIFLSHTLTIVVTALVILTIPALTIRRYYVHYKLIQQWTDAYPMETIFTYLLFRFMSIYFLFRLITLYISFSFMIARFPQVFLSLSSGLLRMMFHIP